MVPRGGFEPPTRGFSIHCSTPELPGHRGTQLRSGVGVLGSGGGTVQCLFTAIDRQAPSAALKVHFRFLPKPFQGLRGRVKEQHKTRSSTWPNPHPHSDANKRVYTWGRFAWRRLGSSFRPLLVPGPHSAECAPVCVATHNAPKGSTRPERSQQCPLEMHRAEHLRRGDGLSWASGPDQA